MDGDQNLSDLFDDSECDIFGILEALEGGGGGGGGGNSGITSKFNDNINNQTAKIATTITTTTSDEITGLVSEEGKKRKLISQKSTGSSATLQEEETIENKISHITVERNRRKQMNEHLSVLRTLMPCFYAKRVRHTHFYFYLFFRSFHILFSKLY